MNTLHIRRNIPGTTAWRITEWVLLALALTTCAGAQIPSYRIINLGTLGGTGAAARGVNNESVVAGQSHTGSEQHAFRCTVDIDDVPVMTSLGRLPDTTGSDGQNIGPDGTVVGNSDNQPTRWTAASPAPLPGIVDVPRGIAFAAARNGIQVGHLNLFIPVWRIVEKRAVKWQNGSATQLHPVDATISQATDINVSGQCAGWASATALGPPQAMRWGGGAPTNVHDGFPRSYSHGLALNNEGTVVGMAFNAASATDAVPVWAIAGADMTLLPLPGSTPRGRALDINNHGATVGFGDPGTVALLWLPDADTPVPTDTKVVELQTRIPVDSGWTLRSATSINDKGEIAGWGILAGQTRAFLLRPTDYFPCDIKTEVLDPAAPEPEPSPGYPFLTNRDLTTDKTKLATGGQPAIGLVSDGTTRLLLRMIASHPGSVTVSFPVLGDAEEPPATGLSEHDGWLGVPGSKPSASSVTTATTTIGGKHLAFAVYRAPEAMPAAFNSVATRKITLKVHFDGPLGRAAADRYVTLRVDRPPVVVMHGLWSTMDKAFGPFRFFVKQSINGLRIAGPNYPNAAHLVDNKDQLKNQINWFRNDLRQEHMAMTQADVIGHSMGGLLSRRWAAEKSSHHLANYQEGDINRLVTIDSLHCGAILADAAWLWLTGVGFADPDLRSFLENLIAKKGDPPDFGAFDDFRSFGPVIADLSGRHTDARAHTIAGNYHVTVDLCSLSVVTEPIIAPLICALKFFGFNPSANIATGTDLLVGVESQLGGLVAPATSSYIHAHSGAANQPDVIADCVGLLRAGPSTSFFANGFPFGCTPLAVSPHVGTVPTLRTSGGVLISDPPPGAIRISGGTVAVDATADPGSGLTAVLFTMLGTMANVMAPPFAAELTIPVDALGTVTLTVFGQHADGSISTAERMITVTTTAALTTLAADPPAIGMFSLIHRERARIEGTFADTVVRDLTCGATGTTYLSTNPGVVTVNADGWLTPVANGIATVTATHGAKTVPVAVTVALVPESDLALTGSVAPLVLITGESATLSFTATNHGPAVARPVNVFLHGSPAVALTGTTAISGAWNNNVEPVWNLSTLAAPGSVALSASVKAVSPGEGTVTAAITGAGRELTAENNTLSIPVRIFADPHFDFAPGGASAHFLTEAGVTYTLETSPDLDPDNWTPEASVLGDGTEKFFPLSELALRLFHRLRLTVP